MSRLSPPARALWIDLVDLGLREDLGPGDATSLAVLDPELRGDARIEAREPLVVAGLDVARAVFERLGVEFRAVVEDGEPAAADQVIAQVRGRAIDLLAAERVALNFLQRLCAIATLTRRYVDAVAGTGARILDTRKTLPGYRALDKYAVRCGGGTNHRMGLFDGILIKDNHIAAAGGVGAAVKAAREGGSSHLRVRVEVESLEMAAEAIEAGCDALLVDNQSPESTRQIVALAAGRVVTEASGGLTLETVAEHARSGVDEISIGALTHSVVAADLALEWNSTSSD